MIRSTPTIDDAGDGEIGGRFKVVRAPPSMSGAPRPAGAAQSAPAVVDAPPYKKVAADGLLARGPLCAETGDR